jgi:OOP family OmpA-OmpF porin
MLKKIALLLFITSSLFCEENYLSFKFGQTSIDNDGGMEFNNNSYEMDVVIDTGYTILPRVGVAYVDIDEKDESVSGLLQFNLEGIYDFDIQSSLTPYIFGGGGYENVTNSRKNFDSNIFIDGGLGLKYPLNNSINLLSEFKTLYMLGGTDQDAEFAWYVGLSIDFGYAQDIPKDSDGDGVFDYSDSCANTPYGTSVDARGCPQSRVVEVDSDGDSVPDSIDQCPNTPIGLGVDVRGCAVVAHQIEPQVIEKPKVQKRNKVYDSDKDGVKDSLDQCPNTLKGFSVNSVGCPIKKTLEVRFDPNSYMVTFDSKPKISEFANFMRRYPNAKITIIGYTDTSGHRAQNKILSLKRAQSVKSLLVKYGISGSKITAIGKGDLNPIAPNDTVEGREKNRRIEAVLK